MKKPIQKKIKFWPYLNSMLLLATLIAFSLCRGAPSYAALKKSEVSALLAQGNVLFRQANTYEATDPARATSLYLKSIMRFEKVIKDGGIQNGKLYYNIGNAYIRVKDLGRAILNYRRAIQFLPNDANLRQNLNYARILRKDKVEETQKTKIFKTLFFWHYDLSISSRIFLFSLSFVLTWVMAAVKLYYKNPFVRWTGFISAAVAMLLVSSLLVEGYALHTLRPGVIIDTVVTARKGNSETYEPSFTEPLHAGLEFNLVENRGHWYFIELPDSRRCWVPKESAALVR